MPPLTLHTGKVCPSCGEYKIPEQFGTRTSLKTGKMHLNSWCRPCHSIRTRQSTRIYRASHQNASWKYNIKKNYGLTVEQYNEMLEHQSGVCAICEEKPKGKRLAVDHCHESGQVRGLLCDMCNHGLGRFKDNPDLMRRGIAYLQAAQ